MAVSAMIRACAILTAAATVSACAPSAYTVTAPTPSTIVYKSSQQQQQALNVAIKDSRLAGDAGFFSGTLPATLKFGDAPLDSTAFLASQLQAELQARGLPSKVSMGTDGAVRLDLLTFKMLNYRMNAYTPFVTSTYLSGDLTYGPVTKRVGVWVKRGKVPVWSFDEIVQPTLNDPLSIAVKELAAKIAAVAGGYRADDKAVEDLVAKLASRSANSFEDVYALGFTNNPKAVDAVVKLVNDQDEYIRLAAISSLGTLNATSQFGLLKSLYEDTSSEWPFRAMSLKSIGDLGTPEAKAYLTEQAKALGAQPSTDRGISFMNQVIAMYLL